MSTGGLDGQDETRPHWFRGVEVTGPLDSLNEPRTLETMAWRERLPCPTDRRVLWAQITDEGLRVLNEATRVHLHDLDQHFVSRLNSAEIDTLTGLLRRLHEDRASAGWAYRLMIRRR